MTREEAKELLPIITAFAEGKTIQCKAKNKPNGNWIDIKRPIWDSLLDYRIKPEPREYWLCSSYNFTAKVAAEHYKRATNGDPEIIHVKEVID